jgi:hypothetical protein
MYCCMSSQSQCEIKTSAKGHEIRRAVRLQENAVTLKSLFIDLDSKDYNSPDEAVVALGKFITKVDMPKPSVLVKTALALFWPGSQRWSPTSRELANRQLGLSFS